MTIPEIRVCSMCGKAYGAEYADTFCECGFELLPGGSARSAPGPAAQAVPPATPQRPPPGTRCLVLFGPDRSPLQYFPLTKDVTVIGRQDPVEGNFPDIDLEAWLDAATARRVSRQHALVLRSRLDESYYLRPLAGNTGTQLEMDMVPAQEDLLLQPGNRLILGGAVRFKFEIA